MLRICLISHGQPSRNPRLVRDANALSIAGYYVTVITPRFLEEWISFDESIISQSAWNYQYIDYLTGFHKHVKWNYIRARRRIGDLLTSRGLMSENLVALACNYVNPELANLAVKSKSNLYVAHQQHSLPAAVWAAQRTNAKFAIDVHDLLADCSTEKIELIRNIEKRYLNKCAYISTMSDVAAKRIQETNNLSIEPIVLHNTPSLKERKGINPPNNRPTNKMVSIYWFGQTIGRHSCAEQVLKSMPLLCQPVKLVLRGNPDREYVSRLLELATKLNLENNLEILPLASPTKMVKLASEHDIVLATQPGDELFHQMAIGNKLFTGMIAGLALALTDTIAYRYLWNRFPKCGFIFPDEDEYTLAQQLNHILYNPTILQSMKNCSWNISEVYFNWEVESKKLLNTISKISF